MKKVLLLGDSIRKGYCAYVRENLQDLATVYYPEDNCRYTQFTYVELANWIKLTEEPEQVDVIHWNNGHWDIAHWDRAPESLNSVELYLEMLERIYRRLTTYCPRARIVFALTTPMNESVASSNNTRTTVEIDRYNVAARELMELLGVHVNDLFAVASKFPAAHYSDYAHFTEAGYRILADAVSDRIRENL